jgi:predicted DNA-binding antitoxin AbrB/MazE fold protein
MGIEKKYRGPKIVAPGQGGPSWLRIVLLLALAVGVGWYGYQMGGARLGSALSVLKPDVKQKLKELEAERDELRRQLTMARQSAQMDQEAIKAIKEQVKRFQDERLKMEEELAFLRGIVSTGPNKKGLRIQNFKLEPGIEPQLYSYKFSVSQVINSGLTAKGKILVSVEGLQNGVTKTLTMSDLSEGKEQSIKMRFRYFQNVEGDLKLPEGFVPANLTIEVKPDNGKLKPVTETYEWSSEE